MAKSQERQGTEYVALPKGSIDALGNDEPVTDEEMAFDEFIAGMSAERMGELRVGKIKVARDGTPVANTRGAHCFACPIDQYTYSGLLEHIRNRYGAGLYRVVGIETGKRGLVFNRLIEIAEDIGPVGKGQESALNSPGNLFESVGKIMAESQARTEGLIARLTESRAPAVVPPDPMDMMTKMAGLFATIMGAAPKPATAGGDLLDSLEKIVKLKELLGGLGGDGGGSDKESNFYDVVKTGISSFGPALAALAMRAQQAAQSQPPALAPPSQNPPINYPLPPQVPANAPPGQSDETMNLKKQVDILVSNAKMGADPMQLAGTILDLTPDEKLDDLGNMLEAPDMIEKMASLNPEVNNHRDFFAKLRDSLLTLLDDGSADTLAPNATPVPGAAGAGGSGASTT